jgi:hypothetical protein
MVRTEVAMKYTVKISKEDRFTYRKSDGLCAPWAWASEQFGKPGWDLVSPKNEQRWNTSTYIEFYFRDEQDAVLFALRWGTGVE